MAQLTVIHNAFDIKDKSTFTLEANRPIYSLLNNYLDKYKDSDFDIVFSVNGLLMENYGYVLKETDHLVAVPIPAGGGGGSKNIIRIVAMIAIAVYAPYLAGSFMGATAGMVGAGVYGGMSGAMIYAGLQGAVMIAGGLLLNAIMPIQTPSLNVSTDLAEVSPTYSFSGGGSNAVVEGTTLPLVFGKAKITPPVIGRYVTSGEDTQDLNVLMALNEGAIDTVTDIKINDQSIDDYTDIDFSLRYGASDQTPIPNFTDNAVTFSQNRTMNDISTLVNYETSSNAVNELRVCMALPQGLYDIDSRGDYQDYSIEFELKYRLVGSTVWNYAVSREVNTYKYVYVAYYGDDSGSYEQYYEYDEYKGTSYNGGKFVRKYIVNTETVMSALIEGTYKTTKRFVYKIPELEAGQYEIEIQRLSEYDEDTTIANGLVFEYINEISYDDLTYPNVSLLGIDALATDQLNGGFPQISCVVENKVLKYWENDSLVVDTLKSMSNPAWACYAVLKKAGISDSNIDMESFNSFADFCSTNSYECNLILDSSMDLPSALNIIAPLGRGKVIQIGTQWSVLIDKVVELPTQSFLFTSGNIIENSFTMDYIPYTDRANVVEVTYYDENNYYTPTTVQAQAENFDITQDETKTSINYYGCTNKAMASAYAQFLINTNRYLSETVSFDAHIDSIACTVGDVIKVGKQYMTNTLADGRILNVEGNSVKLDREVYLDSTKSYHLDFRHSKSDTLVTVEILAEDTTTDTLTMVSPDLNPSRFDVYAFGETGYQTNLYRVLDISRKSDFTRSIKALEYIPEVYDDTLEVPDEVVLNPYTIQDLRATDVLVRNSDGTISEFLDISWAGRGFALETKIFIDGTYIGKSSTTNFLWTEPVRGKVYTIQVGDESISHTYEGLSTPPNPVTNLSVSESGNIFRLNWSHTKPIDFKHYEIHNDIEVLGVTTNNSFVTDMIAGAGTKSFTVYAVDILGTKSTPVTTSIIPQPPASVSRFVVSDMKNNIKKFEWNKVADADLAGYEIRFAFGISTNWNNAVAMHEGLIQSTFWETTLNPTAGTYTVMIRAIDTAGNISTDSAIVTFNQADSYIDNLIESYDFQATGFQGTLTNCIVDINGYLVANNAEDLFYGSDTDIFYPQDAELFYPQVEFPVMTFESEYTVIAKGVFSIQFEGDGSPSFYYRKQGDTDWIRYTGSFNATAGTYQGKVEFPKSTEQSIIRELKVIVDAPDIIEKFDDVTIPTAGLTITSSKIDIMRNVQVTVQETGTGAFKAVVTKPTDYSYATVKLYDINETLVGGLVDIIVTGYNIS